MARLKHLILASLAWVALPSPLPADDSQPVQALLLRAVITTCKLDESVSFYRDILGQRVIQERDFTADVAAPYVAVSFEPVSTDGRFSRPASRSASRSRNSI